MATPIIDIPRSIIASESGMDVPVAITPTTTPTIENNHRIIRSPPKSAGWVAGPFFRMSKLDANFAPLQIHWNIYGIGPLSRGGSHKIVREAQHCTNATFLKEDQEVPPDFNPLQQFRYSLPIASRWGSPLSTSEPSYRRYCVLAAFFNLPGPWECGSRRFPGNAPPPLDTEVSIVCSMTSSSASYSFRSNLASRFGRFLRLKGYFGDCGRNLQDIFQQSHRAFRPGGCAARGNRPRIRMRWQRWKGPLFRFDGMQKGMHRPSGNTKGVRFQP